MQEKRKQSVAIAVAATLGMLPIISPVAVYAQEEKKEEQAVIQNNTTQIKEKAPAIELPQNLTGKEGQTLQEIALPENWNWIEETTQISKDKTKYPARLTVNDVLYDYSDVEGYNADGHYVECNLTMVVNEQVPVNEHTESEPQGTPLHSNIASTPKSDDIDINEQTFPDQTFREWVIANVAGADDKVLTPTEISKITDIDLSNYSDKGKIVSLQGIGYFTELVNLNVYNSAVNTTNLKSLDVSENTKLETLNCIGNQNLTTLTVKGASALKELKCSVTGITSLDVSNNTNLTLLYCSYTGITSLNASDNKNLTKLYCDSNANLKNLTVKGATALQRLDCYSTGITSLDVSYNTKLNSLFCHFNANLKSLTVKGATALEKLSCYSTGITSLDVSNNEALTSLNCSNTRITSLDVSNNTALTDLYCYETPIAYLNMGVNSNLRTISKDDLKPVNVEVTSDTFKIEDTFAGIDISKISSVTGATYSKGILSNYKKGVPITYTYDCGISGNGNETIDVTLNLIFKSSITITDDLNKTYDGKTVTDLPTVSKSGSTSAISYKWEQKNSNNNWEDIVSAPADVGTYRVTAMLAPDSNFPDATSEPVEFTITQADSTIVVSANLDQTYDGTAVSTFPSITKTGSTGTVSYKWERKKSTNNWEVIATAPSDVGEYRVTATLASDKNYKGATSAPNEFAISQADSTISVTEDLNKTFDKNSVNATPTVSTTGSRGAVSYQWEKKVNDTDWEDIATAPSNAGVYRVSATLASDKNYKGATSAPNEFAISQADSTISVTEDLNKTFDKNSVNATPTVSTTGSRGAVSYQWEKKVNDTDWEDIATAPSNAGVYRVSAILASDKNYKGATSEPYEFTIYQADSSVSVTSDLSKTYDGKTVNELPTVSTTGSRGAVSYQWEKKVNDKKWEIIATAPSDAGVYRVTAILESNSNYKGATSEPYEFTIYQADSTISVTEELNKIYDKNSVNATSAISTTGSSDSVSFKWEKKVSDTDWEDIASAPSNAGVYRVTAILASDKNYKGAISVPVEFTILQASNSWIDNLTITGWTYGENASKPTARASFGDVTFTYSDSENGAFTDTMPINAGTWYVKASIKGTDNYTGLEKTLAFTISPKSVDHNSQLVISDIQSDKDVEELIVKDGDKVLVKGTDYIVDKIQKEETVDVTITFKGNYTGTITKSYMIKREEIKEKEKETGNGIVAAGGIAQTGFFTILSLLPAGCIAMLTGKNRKSKR